MKEEEKLREAVSSGYLLQLASSERLISKVRVDQIAVRLIIAAQSGNTHYFSPLAEEKHTCLHKGC